RSPIVSMTSTLENVDVAAAPVGQAIAAFDLALTLNERRESNGLPAGLHGVLEYRVDLFERSTVDSIATRLVRMLESIATDADQRIGALDLFSAEERMQLLADCRGPSAPIPHSSVVQLVRESVDAHQDAVAVACDTAYLTYQG